MRTACALVVVLASGCLVRETTTTMATRRLALAPTPGAPAAVAGGPGVALGMRLLTAPPQPQAEGGAVAMDVAQPELGAVFRLDDTWYATGKLALAPAALGVHAPKGLPGVPDDATAFELTGGVGTEFKVSSAFGVVLSAECGLAMHSLTVADETRRSATRASPLLAARGAVALTFDAGPVRAWSAGVLGTGTWNDADGTLTTTCSVGCTTTETGELKSTAVGLVGVGLRWQPRPFVSLGVEAWYPLSDVGTRLPLVVAVSLRLGDLDLRQREAPAEPLAEPAEADPGPPVSPPPLPPLSPPPYLPL